MTNASGLLAALAACTVSAQTLADVIISNHPGNDGTQTFGIDATSRTKGMAFTMPAGLDYGLDAITLRLDITSVAVSPLIEIYSDSGGVPGVPLATLTGPASFTLGIDDYVFTPASPFTLQANQSYWIVASSSLGTYSWKASSPSQTPTGLATHLATTFGAYPPTASSSILTTYFVEASIACRADIDGDGQLTFFDFLEFQNLFAAGDLRADFDGDGQLTFFDFLEFQNEFAAGCD